MSGNLTATSMAGDIDGPKASKLQQIEIITKPQNISKDEQAQLASLLTNLRLAFSWCVNLTTAMVRRKLASGELPCDDLLKQEQYRAKVMNYMITQRASAWLNDTITSNITVPFRKKLSEFTPNDLTSLLDQLRPEIPPEANLKNAMSKFANYIIDNHDLKKGAMSSAYWISIAQIHFDDVTHVFKAVLQTFFCQVTAEQHIDPGLWATTYVDISCAMAGGQYDFNDAEFEKLKDEVQKGINDTTRDAIQGAKQSHGAPQPSGATSPASQYFEDVPV